MKIKDCSPCPDSKQTRSSYQKIINRLLRRCYELQEVLRHRNIYIAETSKFIDAMLEAGKITTADLKPYFKKKPEMKPKKLV